MNAPRPAGRTGPPPDPSVNDSVNDSVSGPDDMTLSRLVAVAGHVVAVRRRRFMGSHGLTPHGLAVLGYLERGIAPTQRELARRCGVAASTLNHTVDHLARSGWVERRRDTGDRRLVRLALTEAGRRHLRQVREAADRQIEPLLEHLTPSEERVVRGFLRATVARLQETGQESGQETGHEGGEDAAGAATMPYGPGRF